MSKAVEFKDMGTFGNLSIMLDDWIQAIESDVSKEIAIQRFSEILDEEKELKDNHPEESTDLRKFLLGTHPNISDIQKALINQQTIYIDSPQPFIPLDNIKAAIRRIIEEKIADLKAPLESTSINSASNAQKILKAIMDEDIDTIKKLLDQGMDINMFISEYIEDAPIVYCQVTPLLSAISTLKGGVVGFLCENGANVNLAGTNGDTPLHMAIAMSKINELPQARWFINSSHVKSHVEMLCDAMALYLLANDSNPYLCNVAEKNCLHFASQFGRAKVVRQILSYEGKNAIKIVNLKDKFGYTALHLAGEERDNTPENQKIASDIVIMLYQAGADLGILSRSGDTAEKVHALRGRDIIAETLNSLSKKEKSFINAAASGNIKAVEKALEDKMPINACNGLALYKALGYGHETMVKFLLDKGADIYGRHFYAAGIADVGKRKELFSLLEKHYKKDRLDAATQTDPEPVCPERKEDKIDESSNYTESKLISSAAAGHTNTVIVLAKSGIDINADTNSALYKAAANGHKDTVSELLKLGASVTPEHLFAAALAKDKNSQVSKEIYYLLKQPPKTKEVAIQTNLQRQGGI